MFYCLAKRKRVVLLEFLELNRGKFVCDALVSCAVDADLINHTQVTIVKDAVSNSFGWIL
jgi:hypothetical protein